MEGAYIFSPDYTQNVQGGLSFPRLLLHRPHADPNQPDEPQALLTVMDQHRLQDMDCSTDGVLTPFCNYCMKLEPVKMCRCLDEEISLDLDMIRFDLPKWVQKKDRPTSSATGVPEDRNVMATCSLHRAVPPMTSTGVAGGRWPQGGLDAASHGSTSDAETKKKKGNRAMGKKKYPKAIKYYSKAIKIDPENATYHLNRAIANSALELWKDAELDAAKAVELADQQAPAKRLGWSVLPRRRAREPARAADGSSPVVVWSLFDDPRSHYQLVRARLRRGRCLEAREALKLGLQRFSEDKALQQLGKEVDRAVALLEAKRRKEAVAEQSEEEEEERSAAKSAGPCGAKALTDQARQLSERQPEAALPLLEEALQAARQARQRREEINAQSLMGKVQLKLRRWAEAVASWEAVVQLEGEQFSMEVLEERLALSNAQNNLGIALKNAQRLGEASSAFQEAYRLATNGDDKVATHQASQILQNAAQCLLAQGRAVEAKGLCERSQEICLRLFGEKHGTLALGHLALARCCRAAGTEPTRACEANSTVGGAACFGLNLFSWTQLTWKWEKCILFWTLSLSLSLARSRSRSLSLSQHGSGRDTCCLWRRVSGLSRVLLLPLP
ncbi:unnamed protein product [Durusdinium trenchii]|uniref:Uncharacterized protein n=1 Tax=Durusdinium trenchii TaxID=1381693 RepID=A0ABP0R145_9DINO